MADPRPSRTAARLSEDIGDVLLAIRRMIEDDNALTAARDAPPVDRTKLVQDDAGEFLARRYGGNSALARRMVESASRPALTSVPVEPVVVRPAPAVSLHPEANVSPLRPGDGQRVATPEARKASDWRDWLRPAARETVVQNDSAPAGLSGTVHELADDGDDFAEAFDWKARMRPEVEAPVALSRAGEPVVKELAEKPFDQRSSGWVLKPAPVAYERFVQEDVEAVAPVTAMPAEAPLLQSQIQPDNGNLRELLREMVQEVLSGELGERFSANLRAVIRREVASAVDAQMDRF